jgi:hypothetical protein
MRSLSPASVQAEPAAGLGGRPFLEASTERRCLWPLDGAGADLLVCGEARWPGSTYPYCQRHHTAAVNPRATHGVAAG